MQVWWDVWPDRLGYELAALEAAGLKYQIDEVEKDKGKLVLAVDIQVEGQFLHLVARFPDTYPKTRVEVFAPGLVLKRHQNPFEKNLCLIGGATRNWSTKDTLAGLLLEQLPTAVKIGTAEDPAPFKDEEEPQGEPFSVYYPTVANSSIWVDSSWTLPEHLTEGELDLWLETTRFPIRGAVTKVLQGGRELAVADSKIADIYRDGQHAQGRWIRFAEPIPQSEVGAFLNAVFARKPRWKRQTGGADVIGVVFKEEWEQGRYTDAWIFAVRTQKHAGLVRGSRGGRSDLQTRVPELRPLQHKRIAVIGLGSLGAPAAIEFARCGVGVLHLGDFDCVEAGSVCRWPLGVVEAGKDKTTAIEEFLRVNYPYTDVLTFPAGVGRAMPSPNYSDLKDLARLIDADLVFDAAAEIGVQHILSDAAAEAGKPYVCVSLTSGAWGGVIARIDPGKTGCWMCLQRRIDSKEIAPAPMSMGPNVQAPGCGSPTFTGSGFDATFVALSAVRLAVGMLCGGAHSGYPDVPWDVAVVALRDEAGDTIAPVFITYVLEKTPGCPSCR